MSLKLNLNTARDKLMPLVSKAEGEAWSPEEQLSLCEVMDLLMRVLEVQPRQAEACETPDVLSELRNKLLSCLKTGTEILQEEVSTDVYGGLSPLQVELIRNEEDAVRKEVDEVNAAITKQEQELEKLGQDTSELEEKRNELRKKTWAVRRLKLLSEEVQQLEQQLEEATQPTWANSDLIMAFKSHLTKMHRTQAQVIELLKDAHDCYANDLFDSPQVNDVLQELVKLKAEMAPRKAQARLGKSIELASEVCELTAKLENARSQFENLTKQ